MNCLTINLSVLILSHKCNAEVIKSKLSWRAFPYTYLHAHPSNSNLRREAWYLMYIHFEGVPDILPYNSVNHCMDEQMKTWNDNVHISQLCVLTKFQDIVVIWLLCRCIAAGFAAIQWVPSTWLVRDRNLLIPRFWGMARMCIETHAVNIRPFFEAP